MRMILAVGNDESLLFNRAEILRKCAGKAEVVVAKVTEPVALIKAQLFDLVVLCHTLSIEELVPIVTLAHNQGVEVKVLQVAPTKSRDDTGPIATDEIALIDPKFSVRGVEKILSRQTRKWTIQ
jgi:hypothetical protein